MIIRLQFIAKIQLKLILKNRIVDHNLFML